MPVRTRLLLARLTSSSRPVGGLRVEAWDAERIRPDPLEVAIAGADGAFEMRLDLMAPQVVLRVVDEAGRPVDLTGPAQWEIGAQPGGLEIEIAEETPMTPATGRSFEPVLLAARRAARRPGGEPEAGVLVRIPSEARLEAESFARAELAIQQELLAIVAHDLRSPLNAILLGLRDLEQYVTGDRPKRDLEVMNRAGMRMKELIETLLDQARLEAVGVSSRAQACGAGDLLEEVLTQFETAAEAAGVHLSAGAPGELHVIADRQRLLQVLSNLVDNALKFTPAQGEIHLDARPQGNDVCFTVADNGPGISPADLPHLFDRRWQTGQPEPRPRGGLGLGLHIARTIVELHGGKIWVENTPGGGSVFCFTLRRAPPRERPPLSQDRPFGDGPSSAPD